MIPVHNDSDLSRTETTSVDRINRSERVQCRCFFIIATAEVLAAAMLGYAIGRGWV
jgi:hypothetical protein